LTRRAIFDGLEGLPLINFKFRRFYSPDSHVRAFHATAGLHSLSQLAVGASKPGTVDFFYDVLSAWRATLGRIRNLSRIRVLPFRYYSETGLDSWILSLANCTPYAQLMRVVAGKPKFCGNQAFCPWCWARTYKTLAKSLYSSLELCASKRGVLYKCVKQAHGRVSEPIAKVQLVHWQNEEHVPYLSLSHPVCNLEEYFSEASNRRSIDVATIGAWGSLPRLTIEPSTITTTQKRNGSCVVGAWRIQTGFVGLHNINKALPEDYAHNATKHAVAKRLNLTEMQPHIARAISSTFQYPSGYLLDSYTAALLEMLQARTAVRFRTTLRYGVLRK
jgi:hypothetical protein